MSEEDWTAVNEEIKNNPRFQQLREIAEAEAKGAIKHTGSGNVQGQYVRCPKCDGKNYFQATPNAKFSSFICQHCGEDITPKMNWLLDHMSRLHNKEVSN